MGHEEFAEVSDQVDDGLSGSYHFLNWVQKWCQFAPVEPAKTLAKHVRPTGRDLASNYSFVLGQAQTILLQHLEAEQAFSQKIKSNLLDPFMTHIAQTKSHKEMVDKQMRPLVTKLMNGRRKLAADKKTFMQLLDEYKVCMYDIDANPAQQKKAPNLRKKLSDCALKYERAVKELKTTEEEYRRGIPAQLATLRSLELIRLVEIQSHMQSLSQMLLERAQTMLACRNRLESFVSQLSPANEQHDALLSKWSQTFSGLEELPLVNFDLPLTAQNIDTFPDLPSIVAAEEAFTMAEIKLQQRGSAVKEELLQRQKAWDDVERTEFAQFTQQSQSALQKISEVPLRCQPPPTESQGVVAMRVPSSSRVPEEPRSPWVKLEDPETHEAYYENSETGETCAEEPEGFLQKSSPAEKSPPPPPELKCDVQAVAPAVSEYPGIPVSTEDLPMNEKIRLVGEVQKLFSNAAFVLEGRYFVRQGPLVKKSRAKSQEYEFFLFNDILVWGKRLIKGQKLRMHKSLMIDAKFGVQDLPPKPTVAQEFAIHGVLKSFVVSCANAREKQAWLDAITTCWEIRKGQNVGPDAGHAPIWIQNMEKDHCPVCKRNFNPFRRKHHCRICGELRCADCATKSSSARGVKSQRVCVKCSRLPNPGTSPKPRSVSLTTLGSPRIGTTIPRPMLVSPVTISPSGSSPPSPPPRRPSEAPGLQRHESFPSRPSPPAEFPSQQPEPPPPLFSSSPPSSSNTDTPSADTSPPSTPTALPNPFEPPPFGKSDSRVWLQAEVWTVGIDANSGRPYYYNTQTGESTWTKPPELERPTLCLRWGFLPQAL